MRPYSVLYQQQRDYVVQFKNQPGPSDMHRTQAKFASDSGIPETTFHQWVTKFENGGYDNIGSGMIKVGRTLQEQLDYVVQFQNQPGQKDTHVSLTQFARKSGVPKQTFHQWVIKFKQGKYDNIGSSANATRTIYVCHTLQEQLDYVVQFQNQPGQKDTHVNRAQFARNSGVPKQTFVKWVTKFKHGGYDSIGSSANATRRVQVNHTLQEQLDYIVQFQNQPGPKNTHLSRTQFARNSGVSTQTFHQWVTKFKHGGYDSIGSSANATRRVQVIHTLQEQLDYAVQFQNQPGPKDTHVNRAQFSRNSGISYQTFVSWVTKFKHGGYDNIPSTL